MFKKKNSGLFFDFVQLAFQYFLSSRARREEGGLGLGASAAVRWDQAEPVGHKSYKWLESSSFS